MLPGTRRGNRDAIGFTDYGLFMTQQSYALVLACVAIGCWSTVASAFKLSLRYLEPLQLLLLASLFSTLALLLVVLIRKKWRLLFSISKQHLIFCLLLGFLNPGLYYFVLLEAYRRLPAQEALTINYSWPIVLTIFSAVFLKQRLARVEYAAITLAYIGVLVVATRAEFTQLRFSDTLGVALALGSTLIFSLYWLLNLRRQYDVVITLFLSFLLSLPLLVLATFWWSPFPVAPDINGILGAAYVGCFEMGWTYLLWISALKISHSTARISILAFLSPILSLLIINSVLHEPIKSATWFGLLFIMAGIALRSAYARRSESV